MEKREYQILDGIVYPDDKTEWKGFIDRSSDEVHLPVPDDAVVYGNRRETIPRQIYDMNYTLIQHVSGTDHQLHEYDADIIRTRFEKNEVKKLISCIRVFVGELFFHDSDFSSIVNYFSEDLSHFETFNITRDGDCILRIMAIDRFGRKTDLMIIYDSFPIKDNVSNVQKEYIVIHDFIPNWSQFVRLSGIFLDLFGWFPSGKFQCITRSGGKLLETTGRRSRQSEAYIQQPVSFRPVLVKNRTLNQQFAYA